MNSSFAPHFKNWNVKWMNDELNSEKIGNNQRMQTQYAAIIIADIMI
jgi:hypothetical protein